MKLKKLHFLIICYHDITNSLTSESLVEFIIGATLARFPEIIVLLSVTLLLTTSIAPPIPPK